MKAAISIGRDSLNSFNIRIIDESSGTEFVEVSMTAEQFAFALTGLHTTDCGLVVRGLENVGLRRITEQREIACPIKTYDKKELAEWLKENAQEEGWKLNTYLGSRNSVRYEAESTVLRYSVTKYVKVENRK